MQTLSNIPIEFTLLCYRLLSLALGLLESAELCSRLEHHFVR